MEAMTETDKRISAIARATQRYELRIELPCGGPAWFYRHCDGISEACTMGMEYARRIGGSLVAVRLVGWAREEVRSPPTPNRSWPLRPTIKRSLVQLESALSSVHESLGTLLDQLQGHGGAAARNGIEHAADPHSALSIQASE
jgi:hypothetical protein